jgi:7-cyano-7-deazaguanine synthase
VRKAVVLLSGGLDSATCLAIAQSEQFECHALTVAYGQRHQAEIAAAQRVARALRAASHRVVSIDLGQFGGSALTDSNIAVPEHAGEGIPVTYVPARNTVLLSAALSWAEVLRAMDIYIGANAVDYSGYPDCRPEFIAAFERLANLATKAAVEEGVSYRIHAPLMADSKADIIRRGSALAVDYALTVSCYQADAQGLACRVCDACRLRTAGFLEAGMPDVTRYSVKDPAL